MQLVLISGLSGSGKSIALDVLEDSGYYVVDNLPVKLLPALLDVLAGATYARVAVSVDVRSGGGLQEVPRIREALQGRDLDVRVLFLDAKTDTLVKRYSETRRRHPLADGSNTLPECIERERELLATINPIGHRIDTSDLAANTLRAWVKEFIDVRPDEVLKAYAGSAAAKKVSAWAADPMKQHRVGLLATALRVNIAGRPDLPELKRANPTRVGLGHFLVQAGTRWGAALAETLARLGITPVRPGGA